MRRRVLDVVVLVAMLAALAAVGTVGARTGAGGPGSPTTTARWVAPDQLEEDEPGWDCTTMGNGVCGPVEVAPAWVCERPVDDWVADTGKLDCGPQWVIDGEPVP